MKKLAVLMLIIFSHVCSADTGFVDPGSTSGSTTGGQGTTTVNIAMSIRSASCIVRIDGQIGSGQIKLPDVPVSSLNAKDKTAGDKPFSITLSGCITGQSAYSGTPVLNASVYFEAQNSVDANTGMLINTDNSTSKATNVELEVVDETSKKPIQPGVATGNTTLPVISQGANNFVQFPYTVRYHALGPVTAGDVSSTLVFSINYS